MDRIVTTVTLGEQDWFLQKLVKMVNTSDIEFGITLLVGGFLISGTLICGARYFKLASECHLFRDKEELQSEIYNYHSICIPDNSEVKEGEDVEKPAVELSTDYIHLVNAKFYQLPGGQLPSKGVLWRGRIIQVSGFYLGNLE